MHVNVVIIVSGCGSSCNSCKPIYVQPMGAKADGQCESSLAAVNHLTPTVAIWVSTAMKHPVPDRGRVKPLFVIFDIRAL